MADRLYLSVWFPSFREQEMMQRLLSLFRQFPFSASRPGLSSITVQPISWNEAAIFQQTFDHQIDLDRGIKLAAEFLHEDYAYEFEAYWDLWTPEFEGELDAKWTLKPCKVQFFVHGANFDDEAFQQQGHIQVDFGLDTPFLYEEMELDEDAEMRVKNNVHKLVSFTAAVEKNCGIIGRVLWSESNENLAQKLIARLQKVQ